MSDSKEQFTVQGLINRAHEAAKKLSSIIPPGQEHLTTITSIRDKITEHRSLTALYSQLYNDKKSERAFKVMAEKYKDHLKGADLNQVRHFIRMELENSTTRINDLHSTHKNSLSSLGKAATPTHQPPPYIDIEDRASGFIGQALERYQHWIEGKSPAARMGFAIGGVALGSAISIVGSKYLWDAVTGVKQEVKIASDNIGNTQKFVDQQTLSTANRLVLAVAGGLTSAAGLAVMYAGMPGGFTRRG